MIEAIILVPGSFLPLYLETLQDSRDFCKKMDEWLATDDTVWISFGTPGEEGYVKVVNKAILGYYLREPLRSESELRNRVLSKLDQQLARGDEWMGDEEA